MNHISTNELKRMTGKEGLILQGCGGDPQEWLDGINNLLTEQGILLDGDTFKEASIFEHGGLTNILFHMDGVRLDMGKLAMWRLQSHPQFGGTWLSDYLPNRLGVTQEQQAEHSRTGEQPGASVTWYFPLEVKLRADDNLEYYDDIDYCADDIDSREAVYYKDEILEQLEKENSSFDTPRMLAEYIHDPALSGKVYSMTPTVEEHGGRLWGAMVMRLSGELTPDEISGLKDYISGQNSDGYGESLEQHEIKVSTGELYVSFWHSRGDYAVYTQEEFAALPVNQQAEAPARRKPSCPLTGADGNVFNLIGLAARTLKDNGMAEAAKEMRSRVMESGSYDKALAIITEYVEPAPADGHRSGGFELRM